MRLVLRHAWLNLWDKHMTTGRINQVAVRTWVGTGRTSEDVRIGPAVSVSGTSYGSKSRVRRHPSQQTKFPDRIRIFWLLRREYENTCFQGDMAAGNLLWWQMLILYGKPISDEPPAALGLELALFIDQQESLQCLNCFCDTHLLRSVIKLFKLGRLDKVWLTCGRLYHNNSM